ncbi:MAG: hypothetical protein F2777_03760, partial [Actinobacteria bacterium]|nr:hypothetical protein [Actinomycetota bacterium]
MRRILAMAVTIAAIFSLTPSLAQATPTTKDVSLSRKYQMPVNALLTYRTLQASLSIKT